MRNDHETLELGPCINNTSDVVSGFRLISFPSRVTVASLPQELIFLVFTSVCYGIRDEAQQRKERRNGSKEVTPTMIYWKTIRRFPSVQDPNQRSGKSQCTRDRNRTGKSTFMGN